MSALFFDCIVEFHIILLNSLSAVFFSSDDRRSYCAVVHFGFRLLIEIGDSHQRVNKI